MTLWSDPGFLRRVQYGTDANLRARQSMYAYQRPYIDLVARVIDLADPAPDATVADIGCGNGYYLAELARRDHRGRPLGVDMSTGMLAAGVLSQLPDDGRQPFTVTTHSGVLVCRQADRRRPR